MAEHIIAVETYGSQRVTDPHTDKLVSAYKLSYTSAVTAVLLALYGQHVRDVSPKQASYHYVQIDGEIVVRHGHILLALTMDELAKTEQITRHHHRAGVYLWRDQKWWAFPDSNQADYSEPGYRAGPTFDPVGFRPPSPSTGEREATVRGIIAEKSQRSPEDKPWWWLSGDTYPHRDLLKRCGARFSSRRKQWYFIGADLPALIQALVTTETTEPIQVQSGESPSLLAIFGGRITGKERASNGDIILQGENGIFATRTTWINRADQPEAVWEFDLPPQNRVGNPLPAIQQALQTNQAIYSLYTRKWHFEHPDQVATLDALAAEVPFSDETPHLAQVGATAPSMSPELTAMIETALAADDTQTLEHTPNEPPTEASPPAIRVMRPAHFPADGEPLDAVQTAIRAVKASPTGEHNDVNVVRGFGRTTPIGQAYCGELTGSITGEVFCYGWAVHAGIAVFINMAGPRMGVEAIRAKLSKGDQVSVVPPDAPAVELTAGEGNSGMYHPYLHYLPEARFASLLLVHDWAVTPNYGGKATTFIFRTSHGQASAKLKQHVRQLVNSPVFDTWSAYLYEAGQKAMLVRQTRSAGGIDVLSVDLDGEAWVRLITGGLDQGILTLPE